MSPTELPSSLSALLWALTCLALFSLLIGVLAQLSIARKSSKFIKSLFRRKENNLPLAVMIVPLNGMIKITLRDNSRFSFYMERDKCEIPLSLPERQVVEGWAWLPGLEVGEKSGVINFGDRMIFSFTENPLPSP